MLEKSTTTKENVQLETHDTYEKGENVGFKTIGQVREYEKREKNHLLWVVVQQQQQNSSFILFN